MMNHDELRQALHTIAEKEIESDMDLWPTIQEQLGRNHTRRMRTPLQLVKVVAAAAIILLVGAVGYAFYQSTNYDKGLAAVDESGLITHLDLTQTANDISVTLDYAYADANRISIATHVEGTTMQPPGTPTHQYGLVRSELRDKQGHIFDTVITGGGGGGGGGGGVDPNGTPVPAKFGFEQQLSYDASAIADKPEQLDLRLEMVVGPTAGMVGGGGGGGGNAGSDPMTSADDESTFVFEFSIPFNPGRTLDAPQTLSAGGLDLTLEQVVVTPSITRLVFCFAAPNEESAASNRLWTPSINLKIGDESIADAQIIGSASGGAPATGSENQCTPYFIPLALSDHTGEWTLTVDSMHLSGSENREEVALAVQKMFDAEGIPATMDPQGFMMNAGATQEQIDRAMAIVSAVTAENQRQIGGPWVYHFAPS